MMTIIPIKSFVVRQPDGTLKSYAVGIPYTVSSEEAEYFINEGLAEKASSGGGDFETASVKITNKTGDSLNVLGLPLVYDIEGFTGSMAVAGGQIDQNDSMTVNVPLYKGTAWWMFSAFDYYKLLQFDATGEITATSNYCQIVGDGEITIESGK